MEHMSDPTNVGNLGSSPTRNKRQKFDKQLLKRLHEQGLWHHLICEIQRLYRTSTLEERLFMLSYLLDISCSDPVAYSKYLLAPYDYAWLILKVQGLAKRDFIHVLEGISPYLPTLRNQGLSYQLDLFDKTTLWKTLSTSLQSTGEPGCYEALV